ncbi:hypothetical protein [Yunchengibacter salinarum]|uniref:hypothetical protein n=1 Tax=Yunchengibacter salinarum TaxID=3133399 RepID=UPI0035B5A483
MNNFPLAEAPLGAASNAPLASCHPGRATRLLCAGLILVAGMALAPQAPGAHADQGSVTKDAPADTAENNLLADARKSARIAGSARYCGLEPELIEEYIVNTEARIKSRARDNVDRVLLGIEFKNILAASSIREPTEGCEAFTPRFRRLARQPF